MLHFICAVVFPKCLNLREQTPFLCYCVLSQYKDTTSSSTEGEDPLDEKKRGYTKPRIRLPLYSCNTFWILLNLFVCFYAFRKDYSVELHLQSLLSTLILPGAFFFFFSFLLIGSAGNIRRYFQYSFPFSCLIIPLFDW